MGFVTEWYDSREHEEEAMPIVDKLVAEVREACAVEAEAMAAPGSAAAIRDGGDKGGLTDRARPACAGLDAIRKYFKDYEEVEVAWARDEGCAHSVPPGDDAGTYALGYRGVATTMIIPKPAPEPTVEELARAVVDAYEAGPARGERDAVAALAEKLVKH